MLVEHPEYEWLVDFLSRPRTMPYDMQLLVVDCSDSTVQPRPIDIAGIQARSPPSIPEALLSEIGDPSDGTKTRIILMSYKSEFRLDTTFVDALSHIYEVDPQFLMAQFASREEVRSDSGLPRAYPLWCPPLPSEHKHLLLANNNVRITATFPERSNGTTAQTGIQP